MFSDEDLMAVALSEATKVHIRDTLPNPRVGAAILTKTGKLYFGHHKRAGEPHAEIEAMRSAESAGADLAGASIAVTLEPCSHTGRTGPCADALVKGGFARVMVGIQDPDPRVSGAGLARLRDAGIEVVEGVLSDRCVEVNKEWLHTKQHGVPYVYLKMATSMDGLWTSESGESKWITGSEARAHAHVLRSKVGCVISTLKTIEADRALFSARDASGSPLARQPDLAVVSRRADWGEAWASHNVPAQQVENRKVIEWKSDDLVSLLRELGVRGHVACLVEAGPEFTTQILQQHLAQEIWHYMGARLLGGEGRRLACMALGKLPGYALSMQEVVRFASGDLLLRSKGL